MRYQATTDTIDHIAALVFQVRPGWDPSLVRVVLHSHTAHVDGNDLAIAALRAAHDPNLPTPKAIGWRGPHWRDLDTKPPEVTDSVWCGICRKPEHRCVTERVGVDDDHAFEPTARPAPRRRR